MKNERKTKVNIKTVLLGILFLSLIITNCLTLKLYIDSFKVDDLQVVDDTGDEISRVKYFIKDWYDELIATYTEAKVYYNELRFNNGTYTLTVAGDRIRAVYPRGIRCFQLQYITYIEFFKLDGYLQCRLYYNETGEYIFRLN